MEYLLLLVFLIPAYCFIPKVRLDDQGLIELVSWHEVVEEVNKTNILTQVLQEYLHDIELVEAAVVLKCTNQHRDRYSRAQSVLKKEMSFCTESLQKTREKEALVKCVEEKTRTTVSDIRNHITSLKSCLDSS